MQTRREYAISLGLATPGRGRLSKEAHNAINEAIANGMRFKDVPVNSDSSKPVKSEDVSKDSGAENYFGPTPSKLFDGGWKIEFEGKKISISGTEVCRTCMYSLDYHRCANPTSITPVGDIVQVMRL